MLNDKNELRRIVLTVSELFNADGEKDIVDLLRGFRNNI